MKYVDFSLTQKTNAAFLGGVFCITLFFSPNLKAEAKHGETENLSDSQVAVMASICSSCHAEEKSNGAYAIPSLKKQSAENLAKKLMAYRNDELAGTLMNRIAKGYSEHELQAIATFIATSN